MKSFRNAGMIVIIFLYVSVFYKIMIKMRLPDLVYCSYGDTGALDHLRGRA